MRYDGFVILSFGIYSLLFVNISFMTYMVDSFSDRTLKVWSLDGVADDVEQPINLKAKAVVAAHDKDINSLAIAPNDSLVCSGSQVCNFSILSFLFLFQLLYGTKEGRCSHFGIMLSLR